MSVDSIEATLNELRELETGGRGEGARTSILDLVVVCDTHEEAEQMAEVMAALPYGRPSRTIIAVALEDCREPAFDARVLCMERGEPPQTRPICSELITLIAGEGGAALPSLVASLLLPDLPVFLLWRAKPDFSGLLMELLWPLVNRVVVDSTFQDGTLEAAQELVARRPERVVTDLSWTKITAWRDAVARAFDVPENVPCLRQVTRMEIRHAGHSEAQARLLAGWVQGRVKTRTEVAIIEEEREDMRSGSLTSVSLYCPEKRFGVVRLDEGVARVEAPNMPSHNLALRVPHIEELIAQELEIFERDDVFIEALDWIPTAQETGAA